MDDRFKHHPPKGDLTAERHQEARIAADNFFTVIERIASTSSREKSIAITKVEEAMFWLNADIARNQ